MDSVFPFNLPAATAWYEALYVLTFALHQAFMHYVLAGSLYVTWTALFPGRGPLPRAEQPVAAVLRDWMPFMLSAAITAGVAPLLFVQVLYQRQFYTANLLLGWRWMVVVPVLVVVFYLLYVIKTAAFPRLPRLVQAAIALIAAGGIVFVGFCWTVNHLLSTDQAQWPSVFATGALPFSAGRILLRMLVWLGGAFVSMAVVVGWQLGTSRSDKSADDPSARGLAWLALAGLDTMVVAGAVAVWRAEGTWTMLQSRGGWAYLLMCGAGLVALYAGWIADWLRRRRTRSWLLVATVGWVLTLVAVSVLREVARVVAVDTAALAARHAKAAEIGGFAVFLLFAVVNFAVIAGCVWVVRRRRRTDT